MTTFDERRDEFEKKYFHEEELQFKARSRRNRLFGLAIADRIGKHGEEAADYARQLVMKAAMHPSGDEGLTALVITDLKAAGQSAADTELRQLLMELMERAVAEIRSE